MSHPLNGAALLAEVGTSANGALILFVGTVRDVNDGRAVIGIEYSAYTEMAERELASIVAETAERFGTADIVVEHRLGALALGDASVAIAIGHPRRAAAYDASRHLLEELKRRLPVWKREGYADGSRGWVNQSSPDAPAYR
ncbi:MAG: molybdenum cofactor biosynthesis protein MoaE [Gemmatimonadota bacterium]|nr:molybdenum cofactor biosynthesis protein MoaE [Gemmatimonadota bacterium]